MKDEYPLEVYDVFDKDGKWLTCTQNVQAIRYKLQGWRIGKGAKRIHNQQHKDLGMKAFKRTLGSPNDIAPVEMPEEDPDMESGE